MLLSVDTPSLNGPSRARFFASPCSHIHRLRATGGGVRRERRDRRPEILELLKGEEKSPKQLAEEMGNLSSRQLRRILQGLQGEGLIAPNDAPDRSPRRKYHVVE